MVNQKRASIRPDDLGEKTLADISAADFLQALGAKDGSIGSLAIWPEKKKVELWLEPESFARVHVVDVINVIRSEKKKVELEIPWWGERGRPPWAVDPNPLSSYPELVERITRDVEARLAMTGGYASYRR